MPYLMVLLLMHRCQVGYETDGGAATVTAGDSDDVGRRSAAGAGVGEGEAPHTYDVGPTGHVRETHGRMVGPDEEDFIESEDSDKVRPNPVTGTTCKRKPCKARLQHALSLLHAVR